MSESLVGDSTGHCQLAGERGAPFRHGTGLGEWEGAGVRHRKRVVEGLVARLRGSFGSGGLGRLLAGRRGLKTG